MSLKVGTEPIEEKDRLIRKLKGQILSFKQQHQTLPLYQKNFNLLADKYHNLKCDIAAIEVENRNKNESAFRIISELKNEFQAYKNQHKNLTVQINHLKSDKILLKKQLDQKNQDLQEIQKNSNSLYNANEELSNEGLRMQKYQQALYQQNSLISQKNNNLNIQVIQVNNAINQSKDIYNTLNINKKSKYDKIGHFEEVNNNLDFQIGEKIKIEEAVLLQCRKKEDINNQETQKIIELEGKIKRLRSQIHQKNIIFKTETQRGAGITSEIKLAEITLKKYQNTIREEQRQCRAIAHENNEIHNLNSKITMDLDSCQLHLKNLVDQNEFINNELSKFSEQNQLTLQIMKKKRVASISSTSYNNEYNRTVLTVKNNSKQIYTFTPKKQAKNNKNLEQQNRQTTI